MARRAIDSEIRASIPEEDEKALYERLDTLHAALNAHGDGMALDEFAELVREIAMCLHDVSNVASRWLRDRRSALAEPPRGWFGEPVSDPAAFPVAVGGCTNADHDHKTTMDADGNEVPAQPMVCDHCHLPCHYDFRIDDYEHDDPAVACFLIHGPYRGSPCTPANG
jgi:hypothetical protein